ncbi:MAG: PTS fructose transporter subunit IIA [Salinisphaeraceae bacterium]|nr:PTS fructose transporter subunit IIA [Salinisphaeraceae bacterium]
MIGVLLITHGEMGRHLVDTARGMLDRLSLPTGIIAIDREDEPEQRLDEARRLAARLDAGDGVLLLTDAFGSTPSNVANRVAASGPRRVVTGVNLPMLIRIYNYPELGLSDMVASAVEAGRQGVLACETKDDGRADHA